MLQKKNTKPGKSRISILKSTDFRKQNYDAVSIITEWKEFEKFNWKLLGNKMKVFDGRNIIDQE